MNIGKREQCERSRHFTVADRRSRCPAMRVTPGRFGKGLSDEGSRMKARLEDVGSSRLQNRSRLNPTITLIKVNAAATPFLAIPLPPHPSSPYPTIRRSIHPFTRRPLLNHGNSTTYRYAQIHPIALHIPFFNKVLFRYSCPSLSSIHVPFI